MVTKENSRSDQIFRELRMDILTGKIPGGTRLAESSLAKEKGVSRTPVREALQQLVKEELLYAIPRAGYVVEKLSERDIIDLFETRRSIELVAGLTAIKTISDNEIDALELNLEKTRQAIQEETWKKMIRLDTDFHDIIYKAARNKYLYRICVNLSDYTLKFRQAVIIVPEVAQRAERDHFMIYEALKARDHGRLEHALKSHLDVVKKDILGYLDKLRHDYSL